MQRNICAFNINFVSSICDEFGFHTKFHRSSGFPTKKTSTDRLVDLVKCVNGVSYLSGAGGKKYQDPDVYNVADIELVYSDIPNIKSSQRGYDYANGLSIVDAIFNVGMGSIKDDFFNMTFDTEGLEK